MTDRLPLFSRPLALAFFVLLVVIAASPLLAAPRVSVRAAVQGELIEAKGTDERAEVVSFGAGLVPALTGALKDETVRVADWPTGPQERADVLLTRFDIYAPGARVLVDEGNGKLREIPRSRLAFFSGTVADAVDDPEVMIFAAVDPASGQINGFTRTRDAFHEIHPLSEVPSLAVQPGIRQHLVAPAEVFLAERGEKSSWTCGQNGAPLDFLQEMDQLRQATDARPESVFASAITTLHTATIAVDTDYELLSIKFGGNTTTAGNYIASLIASMTVIYERDLLVRLLQGETILRATSDDPYNQATSGSASVAKLQEFSNLWNTTYASVPRALAMMLSGKQNNGGASGIAWLTSLCNDYYGTSFSQVFTSGTSPSSGDILVVAHELGHNFGSPHTHCYNPPIDNCYSGEGGCYSGPTSCPASQTINGVTNVTGTLMSYCHLGVANCSSKHVFHPASVSRLQPIIESRVNTCIFPAAAAPPAPTLAAVAPLSGPTAGGTAVTLTGTNFQSGATVTFGGTPATSVVFVNSTRITAVAPAKATGTVAVAVNNPDDQDATLNPGYFYAPAPSVTDFHTVSPCRVVDTTDPAGPLGGPALSVGQTRTFDLTGFCGIPSGAKSVALNITVLNPTAQGNLQIFPGNAMPLGTSTLNFPVGNNLANNAILLLATDGTGTLGVKNSSSGVTGLLMDVVGYFQ